MTSIKSAIKKSLIDKCEIECNIPNTLVSIKNSENDGDLKSVKINIEKNDDNIFLFTFDNKYLKKIKKNTELITLPWINKRTDGIIYHFDGMKHIFIIIEIKSKKASRCTDQFKSMHSFLNYLIKSIELDKQDVIQIKNIKVIKVLIIDRTFKGPTKMTDELHFNDRLNANEIQYTRDEKNPISINMLLKGNKQDL